MVEKGRPEEEAVDTVEHAPVARQEGARVLRVWVGWLVGW